MRTKKENKLFFLDVEVIREQGKFTTTIYRKPTFSGVYSNFESFLPSVYKFGIVYTLVYRFFLIFSKWTQFHTELILGHKFAQTIPNTANGILKNAKTSVTLTYEGNFWRSVKIPLINCKI